MGHGVPLWVTAGPKRGGTVDHSAHQGLLDDLTGRVASCFARRETRQTCRHMVNGLLSELDDHNCWTMAEAAGHDRPYRMQHLLSRARVDEQQVLDEAADRTTGHLSAGHDVSDVLLIVDETPDEKSSDGCVGAACQYSRTMGGTVLCQVAVTFTFAAPAGHALIGRALYLPEGWAADEERRERAGALTTSRSRRSRSWPGSCCSTRTIRESGPASSPATGSTAASACARASSSATPATSLPSAPTT
jgi:SRSO17 transposase